MDDTVSPRRPSPVRKSPLFQILLLLGCLLAAIVAVSARADEPALTVNQIIDPAAKTAADVFRFDPRIARIKKNETIRFLGSTGRHTVSSIKHMLPEGAKSFEIRGKPSMDVPFEVEGLYGIRCRVHGHHGMVMLVIVGEGEIDLGAAEAALDKVNAAEREQFSQLIAALREQG
ncbi:MAG: hypothetical protein ABJN26_24400 [Stappiaceae bacterium]